MYLHSLNAPLILCNKIQINDILYNLHMAYGIYSNQKRKHGKAKGKLRRYLMLCLSPTTAKIYSILDNV